MIDHEIILVHGLLSYAWMARESTIHHNFLYILTFPYMLFIVYMTILYYITILNRHNLTLKKKTEQSYSIIENIIEMKVNNEFMVSSFKFIWYYDIHEF